MQALGIHDGVTDGTVHAGEYRVWEVYPWQLPPGGSVDSSCSYH